jgi:poly-gamma-glutamate capsule biosynthesis protein CapA/YwtB (metallophosphatase superfamily)
MEEMMHGELLTISDLASYLFGEGDQRNYKRALRLVQAGNIPHIYTGSRIYVTRSEVERFLAAKPSGGFSPDSEEE